MLLWTRVKALRRPLVAVGTVSLAITLISGAALGMIRGESQRRTPPLIMSKHRAVKAAGGASAMADRFAVLTRPVQPTDALGPALPGPSGRDALTEHGASPSQARLTRSLSGWGAWLVPGQEVVCLYASRMTGPEGGSACPYNAQGSDGFLLSVGGGSSGESEIPANHVLVAGVVPDGVDAVQVAFTSGATQQLDVLNNGYMAILPDDAATVSYSDSNGPQSRLVPSCGSC